MRDLTRRCLEQRGYSVLEAASAEDALELLAKRSGRLDLLLTDVVMPGRVGAASSRIG